MVKYDEILRQLRERAEARFKQASRDPQTLTGLDLDALRHELIVYETELEMQLEELESAYQQLEQSQQRYQSLFDNAPVAYVTTDFKGMLLDANQHFLQMVGQERQAVLRRALAEYVVLEDRDIWHLHQRAMHHTEHAVCNVRLQHPSDNPLHVRMHTRCLQSTEVLLTVVTDVTASYQTQQALTSALEQEQFINVLRARVMSVINHEFRTPLAAVLLMLDVLKRYGDRISEEDRQRRYKTMRSRLWYLNDMIQGVFAAYNLSDQDYQVWPETFDVAAFVQDVVAEAAQVRPELNRVHFHIDAKQDYHVTLDQRLIHQILMCTIDNAIKYSDGDVDFTITCDADWLRLCVEDSGPGIPIDEQSMIFEAFYRGSKTSSIPGTGIGLYMARRAAAAHGGRIWCESEPGQGAAFMVELPRHYSAL